MEEREGREEATEETGEGTRGHLLFTVSISDHLPPGSPLCFFLCLSPLDLIPPSMLISEGHIKGF
jgi:hypothetical protein